MDEKARFDCDGQTYTIRGDDTLYGFAKKFVTQFLESYHVSEIGGVPFAREWAESYGEYTTVDLFGVPVSISASWLADTKDVWGKIIDRNEKHIADYFIRCLYDELVDHFDPSEPYKFCIGMHRFVLYPCEPAEEE